MTVLTGQYFSQLFFSEFPFFIIRESNDNSVRCFDLNNFSLLLVILVPFLFDLDYHLFADPLCLIHFLPLLKCTATVFKQLVQVALLLLSDQYTQHIILLLQLPSKYARFLPKYRRFRTDVWFSECKLSIKLLLDLLFTQLSLRYSRSRCHHLVCELDGLFDIFDLSLPLRLSDVFLGHHCLQLVLLVLVRVDQPDHDLLHTIHVGLFDHLNETLSLQSGRKLRQVSPSRRIQVGMERVLNVLIIGLINGDESVVAISHTEYLKELILNVFGEPRNEEFRVLIKLNHVFLVK